MSLDKLPQSLQNQVAPLVDWSKLPKEMSDAEKMALAHQFDMERMGYGADIDMAKMEYAQELKTSTTR